LDPGNKWIYSDKFGPKPLGDKGVPHRAVRVGDAVFDNMNPNGIPYSEWVDDLGGKQFTTLPHADLKEIPF
jgi:hypothetical protein